MFDILVAGSINADLIFKSRIRPLAGQTVIGEEFRIIPGGKGANQAIAAARLGSKVGFIGCVGNDSNGKMLIENFNKNNVETKYINAVENKPSGVAGIVIAENDNSIIVVPGANYSFTREMIDKNIDVILNSKLMLLQLEIPVEVVEYAIDVCYKNNIKIILNPAPSVKIKKSLIDKVNYLTPNEHECTEIFEDGDIDKHITEYPEKLIVTCGKKGVIYHNKKEIRRISSYKVEAVDTTGAGDAFNGALAVAVVNGFDLEAAINFANKAAALTVTKVGAQSGMPYKHELEDFG